MMQLLQSEATAARRRIPFFVADSTDGFTPKTGETFGAAELQISKNGAAFANRGGTTTELGSGWYSYEATSAELNTFGHITLRVNKSGCVGGATAQVIAENPYEINKITSAEYQRLAKMLYRAAGAGFVWFATPAGGGSGLAAHDATTLAVATAAASAGDVIVALPGVHEPAANLSLPAGVKLVGCGAGLTRLTRVTTTNAPVLQLRENAIIENIQIDNLGASIGQPIGSIATGSPLLYNTVLRRCVLRSAVDTVVVSTGSTPGRHKIRLEDCDLESTFDNIAVFVGSDATGTGIDLDLLRCRLYARGNESRSIYVVDPAGAGAVRVYAHQCTMVRRSSGGLGGVIDIMGANTEVRLSQSIVEASELGGPNSLCVNAQFGAKVILDGATVIDRAKITLATGAQLLYAPPADRANENLDAKVSERAAASSLPEGFASVAIADGAMASNVTRVAGAAVAGVDDLRADVSDLATSEQVADLAAIREKTDQLTFDGTAVVSTGGEGIDPEDLQPILDALDDIKGAGFDAEADNLRIIRSVAQSGGLEPAPGAIDTELSVYERDTLNPVGGARVWITTTAHPSASVVLSNAFTNGAGLVRVTNGTAQGGPLMLLEGEYFLHAVKPGVNIDSPQPFTVEAETGGDE